MSFFNIFSKKEAKSLPSKTELLENLINASEKPSEEYASEKAAQIAGIMQVLYTQMQERDEAGEYQYKTKDIFTALASSINLEDKDPTLYDMCLAICKDIDNSPIEKEFAYHNKQHFTEAMVNCYVLGKVKGLDDDTISKLLFTALIHDFRYEKAKGLPALVQKLIENGNPIIPKEYEKYLYIETTTKKGKTVNTVKFKASGLEQFSCDQAERYLKQEFKIEEKAELPNEIQDQLNFSRAIIATTDIFSPKTKELVEAIKGGEEELNKFIENHENKKEYPFLVEYAQYFIEQYFIKNPQAIEAMKTMLEADLLSSSILMELSRDKNEQVLKELGFFGDGSKALEGQLNFLEGTAALLFGKNHVFSEQFENTKNSTAKMIEDAEKKMIKDAEKKGYFSPVIDELKSLWRGFLSFIERNKPESCLEKQLPTPFDSGITEPRQILVVPSPSFTQHSEGISR
jgi:hypothetical protein